MDLFRKNLQTLMERADISQRRLAEVTGIPQPMLSRYLMGKTTPGLDVLDSLARAFGVTPSELIRGADLPAPRIERASISEDLRQETAKIAREAAREAVKELTSMRPTAAFDAELSETLDHLQAVKDNPVALAAVRDLLKPFLAKAAKKRGESA